MEDQEQSKTFNHGRAAKSDLIAIVGELEHARRHAIRSANVKKEDDSEESFRFLVWAIQAKEMRRELMQKYFGDIKPEYWCLCKSMACLRQLAYETCDNDPDFLKDVDGLVDSVWGAALGEDLSDCEACREDKKSVSIDHMGDN